MTIVRIRQVLSHGLLGRDFIVKAWTRQDDDGRFEEPILLVTTGNGRRVTDEEVLSAARDAVMSELARRVDVMDQSPELESEEDET